jgi:DNA-binding Lrp family transcriptional regulator
LRVIADLLGLDAQITVSSAVIIRHDAGRTGNSPEVMGETAAVDERDRKLLTILRRDARRPIVALARDINLSRTATQERLARLQASGVIRGFTTVEQEGPAGRQCAYLSIQLDRGFRCAQVVPKLKAVAGVSLIHSVSGPIDLIVRAEGADVAEIEQCRSTIAAIEGVGSVSTSIVLERHLD